MIENIESKGVLLAMVVRSGFRKDGIEFFTPSDFSQQLAYMNRPQGYRIQPHVHNEVHREVFLTQEVLFIRSGRVQVDFYDAHREPVCDVVLKAGDVILLASGGHGFTMLEPTEMIEVKQGPYAGDRDKTRFDPATKKNI
jgi:mannose-6-phosphate isomerase-like protein (cupin superfamily)